MSRFFRWFPKADSLESGKEGLDILPGMTPGSQQHKSDKDHENDKEPGGMDETDQQTGSVAEADKHGEHGPAGEDEGCQYEIDQISHGNP